MYTEHFGLTGRPFAITPDPRYLFLSARHRDALAHLLYGVTESGGFIQLTGEVGTGKTTLTRTLLAQLPPNVDAALVYNPRASLVEFLETICDELQVPRPDGPASPKRLTDALNRHLLDAHAAGRRTVLIVDEAQNLDRDLLEQVRLLTNLETHTEKLLQILLIGQPELRETLARDDLRQLAQRITARYHLAPLDEAETAAYVRHRLEVAGARRPLFTRAALRAVHRYSGGVPRLINILCDRALLGAYAESADQVDAGLVRHASRELEGGTVRKRRLRVAGATAALVALAAAGVAWHMHPPHPVGLDAQAIAAVTLDAEPEPEPESEAPAPTLRDALAVDDDLAATASELLALWGVNDADGLPGALCTVATDAGLACARGRGTWNNLRLLGRPALLELRVDGVTRTVLLTGLGDSHARIVTGGDHHLLPVGEIDRAWLGEYLLLWRPPLTEARVLRTGSRGADVAWLRTALADWGADAPAGDWFDADLEQEVRAFQYALALDVDGIVGEQTLIHLDGLTAQDGPRLDVTDP